MSIWTHVSGIIRLDNFGMAIVQGVTPEEKNHLIINAAKKELGKTCTFED